MTDTTENEVEEKRGFKDFRNGIKNLWELIGDRKREVAFLVVTVILAQLMSLITPYLFKLIFDELPQILENREISTYLILLIAALFFFRFLHIVVVFFVQYIRMEKVMVKLEQYWPVLTQKKMLQLSLGYHERENTGKKVSKITEGCNRLNQLVADIYWNFFPEVLYLIFNVVIIIVLDWKLGVLFIIPFVFGIGIGNHAHKKQYKEWKSLTKKREKADGFFTQALLNVKTVQSFVREDYEVDRHSNLREEMVEQEIKVDYSLRKYFFSMSAIFNFLLIAIIVLGLYFVYLGISTIGTVVYIIVTGNGSMGRLHNLIRSYTRMMRGFVVVDRLKEILEEKPDVENSNNAFIPKSFTGKICFDNVSFTYPNKDVPVLRNLSVDLQPKEMVALFGKSGIGKTTLVRLICRMYDIDEGRISLDGADIRLLDLYWYRRLFAIVQQEVEIFDTSLHNNIVYPSDSVTADQVKQAIKAAHLDGMVNDKARFPDGLETQVGERGVRLSGGEKQRVGIARAYVALLHGARILILDEATSNLDSEAEEVVHEMIDKVRKTMDISIVAIAHRISTIKKADRICVIDDGVILEQGSHKELIDLQGHYAKLVKLQKVNGL
ncbi:ABC transporter ATP-binding protein [Candidatus Falkowbacteria bacterium]|jgi:ABC-type multidrug transport system fused ATPase/permease subunit|nr:ABC transporter ATP-binding protein [Candidatus Falkowbacteria bacterium]MBT5503732.1 ABC transporter ATP-binding protein [Candidatus Falkowbacteria bacterium]MBT6573789.1 ABC transporter ATP-binding protein [Candidatus Falkowbacteria bacterium]MBT7348121.1 ABC transporter ATP-binding protein [Candidatus Falkowbacteria bacterium]MBT7500707.1 ABC transporter ATP-binding protein [Candidatus Falkowbacteria bacterium]